MDGAGDAEERGQELEALEAIYGADFSPSAPGGSGEPSFALRIAPSGSPVHVSVLMHVVLPRGYPSSTAPLLRCEGLGLSPGGAAAVQAAAESGAASAAGGPAVYAAAEAARTWLEAHNEAPDAGSAHDEMMRRQRESAKDGGGEELHGGG